MGPRFLRDAVCDTTKEPRPPGCSLTIEERHMTTVQTDSRPLPDITEHEPEFPRTEIALLVLVPSFVAVMRWVAGPKLFESLFAKTFVILGSQLLVTWFTASMILWYVRVLYRRGVAGITATQNEEGQFDLEIDEVRIGGYLLTLIILFIGLFLSLFFLGRDDLSVGIPLFTLWSIVTGALMALALIRVDENLGAKVLGITAAVTFIAALLGIYSGIDFAFLGNVLFIALILLIIGYVVRLFVAKPRATQRFMAGFGVAIFTGYLLFDFNRLNALEDTPDADTWSVAMDLAIDIYLDIINLFLLLLDLMSE